MENDKSSNKKSTIQLVPGTNRYEIVTASEQAMKSLFVTLSDHGMEINESTMVTIKKIIDSERITIEQMEYGIVECYKEEAFFTMSNIIKHIRNQHHHAGIV